MDRGRGIEKFCSSSEETIQFGKELGQKAKRNAIFCLFGDLGAGKTTLVKGIVWGCTGISPLSVSSPTFVYLNIYSSQEASLYHFDLYRLKGVDDFLAMGFDEYLFDSCVTCIEWSERIASILPPDVIKIDLTFVDEGLRKIKIEDNGKNLL
jgi:tRNA threonylcarbamoyladenosine biosynthesis protein TsaE